jgi:hypothetical protein
VQKLTKVFAKLMYPPTPKKREEEEHFARDSCKEKEKPSHMKETQPHKLLSVFFYQILCQISTLYSQ